VKEMKLFGSAIVNELGHLEIGGCSTTDLVKQYGTPLYVMDEAHIRQQCQLFNKSFSSERIKTEVLYASKAFLTIAMCKLIKEENLSLDVVSGGELYTALKANFPVEKIYFHGNNKTNSELEMAVKNNVGTIIVDNLNEANLLASICQSYDKQMNVLLRVNPGIEAHTHEYISTTKNDSKFGESIFSEDTFNIIKSIDDSQYLNFRGFHSHIGSQIFEAESFYRQVAIMMTYLKTVKRNVDVETHELNLGGGFGIYYVEGDTPIDLKTFLQELLERVENDAVGLNIPIPKVLIEPGRAIVGNSGVTLYTVGSTKTTFGQKKYVFVDGSMADNIRTALYDAKYEAALANRMNDCCEEVYTVTGKCCESGDILVKSALLPIPNKDDILTVFSTGAYNYSMSSNYNHLTRPAVVFVKDGFARIVVKRQTYEDLIRNDIE